jgi:hypothetical protein
MPPDQLIGIEPVRAKPRGVAAAERIEQFSRQLGAFENNTLKIPARC